MSDSSGEVKIKMGIVGKTILGTYLAILTSLLIYLIFALWISAESDTSNVINVLLFGQEVSFTTDQQIIALVVIVAALGSTVHTATSFAAFAGNQRLYRNWTWWYILRLFSGAALALLFYLVIRGGFLAAGSTTEDMNIFGVTAVAGLVGLFSKQAIAKLRELFDNLFKVDKPDEESDKLTNPIPQIIDIDPHDTPLGSKNVVLMITGSNFIEDSIAKLDGKGTVTTFINTSKLSIAVPDLKVTQKCNIEITVFNPPPVGGESNTKTISVI